MNTAYTFLYYKTSGMSDFAKLCDITDHPDVRRVPDKIDASTLSDDFDKFEKSIRKAPDMTYGCLYNVDDYAKIKDLEDTVVTYQIRFGENGQYGCHQWEGTTFFQISGGGVGDLRKGSITFYPSSDFTAVDPTVVYIKPIGDKSFTGTLTINVMTSPDNATVTAASSATEKATVDVVGHTVTVTSVAAGTAVITVTGAKAGLTSGTETFTVTVL